MKKFFKHNLYNFMHGYDFCFVKIYLKITHKTVSCFKKL